MAHTTTLLDRFGSYLPTQEAVTRGITSKITWRAYDSDVRQFANFLAKRRPGVSTDTLLIEATKQDVTDFIRTLATGVSEDVAKKTGEKPVPPIAVSTGRRKMAAIHRFYEWAYVIARLIPIGSLAKFNPHVTYQRLDSVPTLVPDEVVLQLRTELKDAGALKELAFVDLIRTTGLRISEVLVLKAEHLVLNEKNPDLFRVCTNDERSFELDAEASNSMLQYRLSLKEPAGKDGKPLFQNKFGGPISCRTMRRNIERYSKSGAASQATPIRLRMSKMLRVIVKIDDDTACSLFKIDRSYVLQLRNIVRNTSHVAVRVA